MQGLELLKEVPGYKAILKAVIKQQIQSLVYQLAEHTGEESVLISASIDEGTLTHLGSDFGRYFLDGREEIKAQFLGFCLKRKQIKHSTQQTSHPHTRKKGPCTSRGKPLAVRSLNGSHIPYHAPYSTPIMNNQISQENLTTYSTAALTRVPESSPYYSATMVKNPSCDNAKFNKTGSYEYYPVSLECQSAADCVDQSERNGLVSSAAENYARTLPTDNDVSPMIFTTHISSATQISSVSARPVSSAAKMSSAANSVSTSNKSTSSKITSKASQMEVEIKKTGEKTNQEVADVKIEMEEDPGADNQDEDITNGMSPSFRKKEEHPEAMGQTDNITTDGLLKDCELENAEPGLQNTASEMHDLTLKIEVQSTDDLEDTSNPNTENFEYTLDSAPDFNIGTVKYPLAASDRKSSRKSAGPKKHVSNVSLLVKPKMNTLSLKTVKTEQERKSDLENYLYLDHSDRPYPCNMCPKRFKERHHLIYHIRTHSGHRPYKCPICGKAFTQSSSLNTHKRTHWKDINCLKCGKVFRKQTQYYNHVCVG